MKVPFELVLFWLIGGAAVIYLARHSFGPGWHNAAASWAVTIFGSFVVGSFVYWLLAWLGYVPCIQGLDC